MDPLDLFYEINFDHLPCQSNIYGVTKIAPTDSDPSTKILVALTKGKVHMCEYHVHSANLQKGSREMPLQYIPQDCNVVSIDSFHCDARGLIVGVTYSEESGEHFLNIYCNYSDNVPSHERDLEKVTHRPTFKNFALNFTPYQLTHRKVKRWGDQKGRSVFILLGVDNFHVYSQTTDNVEFIEDDTKHYFVELETCVSNPTYLDICSLNSTTRATVVGYANGKICLFLVNADENQIINSWSIQHSSIITQVKLFNRADNSDYTNFMLVVTSGREDAVVYSDIFIQGFKNPVILTSSGSGDVVTCCAVTSNKINNSTEIFIGTYDHRVLVYRDTTPAKPYTEIKPIWVRKFAHPVLKIEVCDMTGDSITELVVFTTSGIHILQRNLDSLLNVYKNALKKLIEQPNSKTKASIEKTVGIPAV